MRVPDPENQTPDGPRAGRGRTWLLYGSLALNLLVLGVVVGAVVTGGPKGGPGGRVVIDSPSALIRALEPEARDALRDQLAADRPERSSRVLESARRSRVLLGALRADPFDPTTFEAALTAQSEALDARNRAGRNALFEVVRGMSVAERQAYADRVEQKLRDRKSRDKGDRPPRAPSGG